MSTNTDAVEAEVVWFNATKGFGFVQPQEGEKAFLHIRQLEAAGLSEVSEGARLKVVIEPGPKGLSVTSVTEVISAPPAAAGQARPRTARPSTGSEKAEETTGTVKWYNSEKGFGFIARDEGGNDIFVHASVLTRCGIASLAEGQAVVIQYVQGQKGPEARDVRLA
ncbi:MAG: cold-shock protein [Rhizobiaceae bacterium]